MPDYYAHGAPGVTPPQLYQFPTQYFENAPEPASSRHQYPHPQAQKQYSIPHNLPSHSEFAPPYHRGHPPYGAPYAPQFVMVSPWGPPIPLQFALPNASNGVPNDVQKKSPADSKGEGKKDSAEGPKEAKGKKDDSKKIPILLSCLCPPVLNGRPTLMYDLRDYPRRAALASPDSPGNPMQLNDHLRGAPITNLSPKSIILISRAFPWLIEVKNNAGVTLDDILNELHDSLSKIVIDTEYWAVSAEMRARLGQAFRANCDNSSPTIYPYGPQRAGPSLSKLRSKEGGLLRMDWLLKRHMLVGLEKDDEFIALRIGDKKLHADVWVLTLVPDRSFS